ncbi:unnamed protein product [Ectocarpus sp. 8 AP-2014]
MLRRPTLATRSSLFSTAQRQPIVGGRQLLAQERKTKTLNEFMHDMENPARAADRQNATLDEHRITQARVEEVGRETGHLDARVVALEEGNRGKKKGLLSRLCGCCWSGNGSRGIWTERRSATTDPVQPTSSPDFGLIPHTPPGGGTCEERDCD